MNFTQAYRRFKSFGGLRLLREYYRLGIVWALVQKAVECIVHRRSLKNVYTVVNDRVTPYLENKYQELVPKECGGFSESASKKVWFCWLQGMDNAPDLIKACYHAACRYMPEREIILIDEENYLSFVEMPEFIVEKRKKGIIPAALFSDLLRLELLIKYGGTWIDSTVLMTNPKTLPTSLKGKDYKADDEGNLDTESGHPWLDGIMNADLFFFQYRNINKRFAGIGNWFITAKPQHWVLVTIRNVLHEYWKEHDCVLNYYIFHAVFNMIVKKHPEIIMTMPKRWAVPSLYLRDRLAMDFDASFWKELTEHVCFHKLNYRKEGEAKSNTNSYLNKILQDIQ